MLLIAAIPVVVFLLFITVVSKDREQLPWEHRASYLAYGVLAVLLVCAVLANFVLQ